MNKNEILNNIDDLVKHSKHEEALKYMESCIEKAQSLGDTDTELMVLNELMGFYRDHGNMDKAISCAAKSEEILDKTNVGNTKERAAAYINSANAYRASGKLNEAMSYFDKAYKVLEICGDEYLYSNYYNNLALLYQEKSDFEKAVECLKKALIIADEKLGDEIKIAISKTNLASSLIRLKRLEEAKELLEQAIVIFEGRTPSDFHYSAALAAMGDLSLFSLNYKNAVKYFEAALSEIELHMGKNNFYKIVSDNLEKTYELLGGRPTRTGMEISEAYYEMFGLPVLKREFCDLMNHIACGLFGEGSECLGYDDEISRDHDFGPSFVILCDDSVSDEDINRLSKAYDMLPRTYMGYERITSKEAAGRRGVVRLRDLLKKATGFDHIVKTSDEWQYTVDENLILLVNGKVFTDESGFLYKIRKYINNEQPYYVYFNKLAVQLELMAKHGQYGYKRAIERRDYATATLCKADFLRATFRALNMMHHKYSPYSKWLRRSIDKLSESTYGPELKNIADEIAKGAPSVKDVEKIEQICNIVRSALVKMGIVITEDTYLAAAAAELKALGQKAYLADEIVDIEWQLFDKVQNEGARASCQDDWGTFSKMRRSQYYLWPMEALQTIYADFSETLKRGRNVITEKYGYMMESTAPEEFAKIKDKLPAITDDKKKMIEAIVSIQVEWMEAFAKEYPTLASNARVIHTSEDTPFNTSYETYLRGELSTYHEDTLYMYGRFVADMSNKNINLTKRTMNMSTFLYGYESLDDAKE